MQKTQLNNRKGGFQMKKLLILGVVLGIIGMLLFACSGGGHHSKTNENNGDNDNN